MFSSKVQGANTFSFNTAVDSVGIEERNGEMFLLHKVEIGETIYGLAKIYALSVDDLMDANPEIADYRIGLGQVLYIPQKINSIKIKAGSEDNGKDQKKVTSETEVNLRTEKKETVLRPDIVSTTKSYEQLIEYKTHIVDQGETLFSICKQYDVAMSEVIAANPGLNVKEIKVGYSMQVPVIRTIAEQDLAKEALRIREKGAGKPKRISKNKLKKVNQKNTERATLESTNQEDAFKAESLEPAIKLFNDIDTSYAKNSLLDSIAKHPQPRYHLVEQGQTLFRIGQLYPSSELTSIRTWNNMESDVIKPGQLLIVGWAALDPSTIPTDLDGQMSTSPDANLRKMKARGIATWLGEEMGTDMLALHDAAPLGSIIEVRNLMNDKTVFVRVIGRMPKNMQDEGAIVKLSFQAAKMLGAHDPKVLVEVLHQLEPAMVSQELLPD